MSAPFQRRLDAALDNAEIYFKRYSGFQVMNPQYKVLFKNLWQELDPSESGMITLANCDRFASQMVANGWTDWNVTDRERRNWSACVRDGGLISVEHFAEISENEGFVPPTPTQPVMPSASKTKSSPTASNTLAQLAIQQKKAKIADLESQLKQEKSELAKLEAQHSNDDPSQQVVPPDWVGEGDEEEEFDDDDISGEIIPPDDFMLGGFGGGKVHKKMIPKGDDRPRDILELIDGTNNHYAVWATGRAWIICAAYDPISPIESCSGTYSGGDPIFHKGKVTRQMYNELEELIVKKIQSKTDLAPSRHKGTGILKAPNQESAVLTSSGYAPIASAFRKLLNL